MYALFLLVVLADVAHTQVLTPAELDTTNGLILVTASHLRFSPTEAGVRLPRIPKSGPVEFTSSEGSARKSWFSTCHAAFKRTQQTTVGTTRGIFDQAIFPINSAYAQLALVDSGLATAPQLAIAPPARIVPTHLGSPAP